MFEQYTTVTKPVYLALTNALTVLDDYNFDLRYYLRFDTAPMDYVEQFIHFVGLSHLWAPFMPESYLRKIAKNAWWYIEYQDYQISLDQLAADAGFTYIHSFTENSKGEREHLHLCITPSFLYIVDRAVFLRWIEQAVTRQLPYWDGRLTLRFCHVADTTWFLKSTAIHYNVQSKSHYTGG